MGKAPIQPLFRPALVLMTGRFLGFVIAFAIPLLLVRIFDQGEFGTYKQLLLVFGTLFVIAQAGMAESLYYFLGNEDQDAGRYVGNTIVALGILGSAVATGLWFWRDTVARLLNNPALPQYMPMIACFLLLMLVAVVMEIVMTVRRRHVVASATYAISDLGRAALMLLPLLFVTDLYFLMLGMVAFAAVRYAAALRFAVREFGTGLRVEPAALRRQLAYALPFGMAALIEVVQVNFHMYAVSYAFDPALFAIYAVGCLQIPLIDFLMTSTSNVMMVNMRERLRDGDLPTVVSMWLDSVRKLALVIFPLVAMLLLTANDLILLMFTDAYQRSIPVFMVWTTSMLFFTLLTDGVLRVFADTRFLVVQNLVRLAVVLVFIQWFLQRFDLVGAVLVTLLATGAAKILALWRIRHLLGLGWHQVLLWRDLGAILVIAGLATVPPMLLDNLVEAPRLIKLMLDGALYVASYYCLLLRFGPMDGDEKVMFASYLGLPLRKLRVVWDRALA